MDKKYLIKIYFISNATKKPSLTEPKKQKIKTEFNSCKFEESNFYNTITLPGIEIKTYLNLLQIIFIENAYINQDLVTSMIDLFYPDQEIHKKTFAIQYKIIQENIFVLKRIVESKIEFKSEPIIYSFSFINPFKYKEEMIFIDITAQLIDSGIYVEASTDNNNRSLDEIILLLDSFSKSETMISILDKIAEEK